MRPGPQRYLAESERKTRHGGHRLHRAHPQAHESPISIFRLVPRLKQQHEMGVGVLRAQSATPLLRDGRQSAKGRRMGGSGAGTHRFWDQIESMSFMLKMAPALTHRIFFPPLRRDLPTGHFLGSRPARSGNRALTQRERQFLALVQTVLTV